MNDVTQMGGVEDLVHQVTLHAFNQDATELEALMTTMSTPQIRAAFVQFAMDTFAPEDDAPLTNADIANEAIAQAAKTFGVPLEAVLSDSRIKAVGDARSVAMSAMRRSGMTLAEIGEHFEKDHTTVRYSVRKVESDPRLAAAAVNIHASILAQDPEPIVPVNTGRHLRLVRDVEAAESVEAVASKVAEGANQTPLQVAIGVAAETFHLSAQDLTGRDNGRVTSDARAVAMMAGRLTNMSLPAIAREFDRDHTSVLAQLRRVEQTPPLMEYAERIAATLPSDAPVVNEVVHETGIEVVPGKARPEHQLSDYAPSYGAGISR